MSFDLQKYYEKIDYFPPAELSAEVLGNVHFAHASHIPFENLDVYTHKEIKLDPDSLYNKMVLQRRGGYCFEMNALLCLALQETGFSVIPCLSRIYRPDLGGFGALTHRVTVVEIDGDKYVCDVGFGGNAFVRPLLLRDGVVQKQMFFSYRIDTSGELDYIVETDSGEGFVPMLGFDLKAAKDSDFELSSYYTSTHPDSFFAKQMICVLKTQTGERTLFDNRLTIKDNGEITVRELCSDELYEVLDRQFDIEASGLELKFL